MKEMRCEHVSEEINEFLELRIVLATGEETKLFVCNDCLKKAWEINDRISECTQEVH